jgi:TrmH family RNA methyltransferase
MGAQFLLPIQDHADLLEALEPFKGTVYAADARGTRQLYEADLTGDTAILLGSEGGGISGPVATQADEALRIPIAEGVESLNVAAAAAMICGERMRQMRLKLR